MARKEKLACEDCSYYSSRKRLVFAHWSQHHQSEGQKRRWLFRCDECFLEVGKPWTKVSNSRGSLSVHWRLLHGGDSELRRLNAAKSRKYALRYICDYCDLAFMMPDGMSSHLNQKHQACVAAYFICSECPDPDRRFGTMKYFRTHQLRTHRPLDFACDGCGYLARTHFNIKRHWHQRHWKLKRFYIRGSCDECSRSFQKAGLAKHFRVRHDR